MSFIEVIPFEKSLGKLKKLYNRVAGPNNNVDNIMLAHSLRPHTMEGHMMLYKSVLHHKDNTLPKWFLETIGVYVSKINRCQYCIDHHLSGLEKLLKNEDLFQKIELNLASESFCGIFNNKFEKALNYVECLTKEAEAISKVHINSLREVGFTDGEILEINQVTAYFNYANRTVLGLGVTTEGDVLGLSPNDSSDMNNWNHK